MIKKNGSSIVPNWAEVPDKRQKEGLRIDGSKKHVQMSL